jgi:hypothetical protein
MRFTIASAHCRYRIGLVLRLACIVVLIGCATPRPVERGVTIVSPRAQLAASTKSDAPLEQPLLPRDRSTSQCRHDSDCSEHDFGFCGYLDDGVNRNHSGAVLAVLRYRGRACMYAMCASSACREEALPTPSKELAESE